MTAFKPAMLLVVGIGGMLVLAAEGQTRAAILNAVELGCGLALVCWFAWMLWDSRDGN